MTPVPNGYENLWWLLQTVIAPGMCAVAAGVFFRRLLGRALTAGVVIVGGVAILAVLGVVTVSFGSLSGFGPWLSTLSGALAGKAGQASPAVVAGFSAGILLDYLRRRERTPA